MKIQFIERHVIPGATRAEDVVYEKGLVKEFKGWVEETYARAYIERGHAAEFDEAADRAARQRAAAEERDRKKLEERAAVVIPDGYAELPLADLRALAVKVTDDKISGKDDAVAAIAAEIARRAALTA